MSIDAIKGFNYWVLGPGVSNSFNEWNKKNLDFGFKKHIEGDDNGNGKQDEGEIFTKKNGKNVEGVDLYLEMPWYYCVTRALGYYPAVAVTSVVAPVIPTAVDVSCGIGSTNQVIGLDQTRVSDKNLSLKLVKDLHTPANPSSISVYYGLNDMWNGGVPVGTDEELTFSLQWLFPNKNILNVVMTPHSGANPAGKQWNEFLRYYRWASATRSYVRKQNLGIGGVLLNIPLTAYSFFAEDIPNALLGLKLWYSPLNNNNRNNPGFYNPSVKRNSDWGVDSYWSLLGNAAFFTASVNLSDGTKAYMPGFECGFNDINGSVRLDVPDLMGDNWGNPFFRIDDLYFKMWGGASYEDLTGSGNRMPINYSTISGGINTTFDLFSQKILLGADFSSEMSPMLRTMNARSLSLGWKWLTLSHSVTDNPVRYYEFNTRPPQQQQITELKVNLNYENSNTMNRFFPIITFGRDAMNQQIISAENGTPELRLTNETWYIKAQFQLSMIPDPVTDEAASLKNLKYVPEIVGDNKYTMPDYITYLDVQGLKSGFDSALAEAVKIIPGDLIEVVSGNKVKTAEKFAVEKRETFNKELEKYKVLVENRGTIADNIEAEVEYAVGLTDNLSKEANKLMLEKTLTTLFNKLTLQEKNDIITDKAKKAKFNADYTNAHKQLEAAYRKAAEDMSKGGINSPEALDIKQKMVALISGLQSEAQKEIIAGIIDNLSKEANELMLEKTVTVLQNRFFDEIQKAGDIIGGATRPNQFEIDNTNIYRKLEAAYRTAAAEMSKGGINSPDALSNKQKIEALINSLQAQAKRLEAIGNWTSVVWTEGEIKSAPEEMVKKMLDKFDNSFYGALPKALAMIPADRKQKFNENKVAGYKALRAECEATIKNNLSSLSGDAVTNITRKMDAFIANLTKDVNDVMIDVKEKELGTKYDAAMKAALEFLDGEERKTEFKNENKTRFDGLKAEYEGVAGNNSVSSQAAKDKEFEIESFMNGLSKAAQSLAQIDNRLMHMRNEFDSRIEEAKSAAYEEIKRQSSKKDAEKFPKLDEVQARCEGEFSNISSICYTLIDSFEIAAKNDGIDSDGAKAADDKIRDFMAKLYDGVKEIMNGSIAKTLGGSK